jgi:ATP-binding cassette, subfamily C, bacterial PrsD
LAPVEVALGSWKQLVAARQSLVRLRDICKVTAKPPAPPVALPRPCRELSVEDISIAAPGVDQPIVSNVSFSLKAGMGLALLGASASGKTSLSKALVGIWPPSINGAMRIWVAISATFRRTLRCWRARLRKTSAGSMNGRRRTRY